MKAVMGALMLATLLSAAAFAQSDVNVSGKWEIETTGRFGPQVQVLTLNQVDTDVVGELAGSGEGPAGSTPISPVNREIFDGAVDGRTVSFYVWRGSDRPTKVVYTGTLNDSGDEITFTVKGGRGRWAPPPGPVLAKRVK
ncbi:MAG: hypothetical protein GEV06_22565 [Luteitalea sp.]|nr:hypothetical protein [Luteitalea sp.]